jgi:hypothetical protein
VVAQIERFKWEALLMDKFDNTDLAFFAVFAIIALIFLTDGWRTRRKQNKRFATLAAGCASSITIVDKYEQRFEFAVNERNFVVSEKLVTTGTGKSASTSYKLITTTALPSKSWQLQFFRVRPRGSVENWLVNKLLARAGKPLTNASGDDFASQFSVENVGGGLPDNWLDQSAKEAIKNFYVQPEDLATLDLEALTAEQGQLEHRLRTPYKTLNSDNLKALLIRQARVADALDEAVRNASRFI